MAEKSSNLSVAQLREILKAQGVKNTSTMRKAQLLQLVEELRAAGQEENRESARKKSGEHQEEEKPAESAVSGEATVNAGSEMTHGTAEQELSGKTAAVEEPARRSLEPGSPLSEKRRGRQPIKKENKISEYKVSEQRKGAAGGEELSRGENAEETVRDEENSGRREYMPRVRAERKRPEISGRRQSYERKYQENNESGPADYKNNDRRRQSWQRESGERYGSRDNNERYGSRYSSRENNERYIQRDSNERYPSRENNERYPSRENNERYIPRENNERYTQRDNSDRYAARENNERYVQRDNNEGYGLAEEAEIPGYGQLDSGQMANGILEVMSEGFGFIRCENYLPGDNDVYVSPAQIRRFNLKTGDIVYGNMKVKTDKEKFSALLYVRAVNGMPPSEAQKRCNFEDMTPIFPNSKINLETAESPVSMRIMDLVSPIGKGQRGMIVSPPKTGKTTLLKQVAKAINTNYPDMNMIILLIDERPEEVTDIKEYIEGNNVEVIYSTFDELPEHHKRVSEMVLERAKRLVEHKKDVVILLDSITRLARAYNLTVPPSGRTLSGGLDPAALHMPKKFFGAARNMREGGSLTVLATALVETGSKMDDVVFEEFKGTGNMEMVLDRRLSEKRIFPAISIPRSGTRREELLLDKDSMEAMYVVRKALSSMKADEALERVLDMFMRTRNNQEFVQMVRHTKFI